MRKRYTKIICAAVAAISAFGLVFSSACSNYKWKAVDEKDNYAKDVYSNGGFLVQTGGELSIIHISEPTRHLRISYALFNKK